MQTTTLASNALIRRGSGDGAAWAIAGGRGGCIRTTYISFDALKSQSLRKVSSLKFSDRTLRLRKGILPKTADFGDTNCVTTVARAGTGALEHAHLGRQRRGILVTHDPAYPGTQKRGHGIQGPAGRDSLQQRHVCCFDMAFELFSRRACPRYIRGGWEEGTGESTCSGAQDPTLSA